jgi:hypothetical protein
VVANWGVGFEKRNRSLFHLFEHGFVADSSAQLHRKNDHLLGSSAKQGVGRQWLGLSRPTPTQAIRCLGQVSPDALAFAVASV